MRLISLLFISILPICGWAQSGSEIIAKHRAATGAELRSNIKSMSMEVDVENPQAGGSISMQLHLVRPDKVSIRMTIMGQKMVMVQNGQEFWMINPMMGDQPQSIPVEQQGQFSQAMDNMDGQFADYEEHPENYEYLGTSTVDDVNYHMVKVLNYPDVEEAVVFFDTKDYFLKRMELKVLGQTALNELKDYRQISGIHMPFEITTKMGETIASKMIIKDVKINLPVNPDLFEKP